MKKVIDILQIIFVIIFILFGLFVSYQIIKKILGGSWDSEDIIVALVILNLGITFTIAINTAKLSSNHNSLRNQFSCLAKDFKTHLTN